MNEITYKRFCINNPKLVQRFDRKIKTSVLPSCNEFNNAEHRVYHSTSNENAQNILKNGFIIDRYTGTQPYGIGIYTAFDKDTAAEFGDKTLTLDVYIKSLITMTNKALANFEALKKEYLQKIKSSILAQKDEYYKKPEWEEKIASQIDDNCEFFAKLEGIPVEEKALTNFLTTESAIILSNLFDEELSREKNKSAILSQTLGIYMDPIQQLVIRDLSDIKKIKD